MYLKPLCPAGQPSWLLARQGYLKLKGIGSPSFFLAPRAEPIPRRLRASEAGLFHFYEGLNSRTKSPLPQVGLFESS